MRRLYAIHDGLGPWHDRWLPWAILPWSEVVPLTAVVRFGEEGLLFDPADAVLVARDGLGGGWVLQGRQSPRFRRFDGTDHRLGSPVSDRGALLDIVGHWVEPG